MKAEPGLGARASEVSHPSSAPFSKRKMFTNQQISNSNPIPEDLENERLGRQRREGLVKFEKQDLFNPRLLKPRQLFVRRDQQTKVDARCQYLDRMRIEGEDDGSPARRPRCSDDLLKERTVSSVMAVEIPDREHRMRDALMVS